MARIDIAYIHDFDAHSQGSEAAAEAAFGAAMRGALPALQELQRAGVVRAIGVGLNQPAWALRWIQEAEIDAVMLAGRLTLLNREADQGVLQACAGRESPTLRPARSTAGCLHVPWARMPASTIGLPVRRCWQSIGG